MPKSKVKCPHCAATMSAPDGADGKVVSCPACTKKFQVQIFDELPEVEEDAAPPKPSVPVETRPSRRRRDREDGEKEEQPTRRRRESDEDEEAPQGRRPRGKDDEHEDGPPRRGWGRKYADGRTDTFGVISLILGILSVVCLFLGCCTCGFTYYAAVPMAGAGAVVGFFGRTNLRVAGLALNFLALVPAIAFAALFATGSGLASIGALADKGTSRTGSGSAPDKEYKFGEEMRFGDLGATVVFAGQAGFTSTTSAGRQLFHDPEFVVTIQFKNYNPNRVVEAGAQVDAATLEDDVGNRYSRIKAKNEIGLENKIDEQISSGKVRPVRSDDKDARDLLVFERPVPGASTLTLTLDASKYGGSGKIKVKIPKSAWAK
jgi:hypothetical protein